MKYLAVDTSGKNLTLILFDGEKEHVFFDDNCGVNHSKSINVEIERLVESAQFHLKDVDFFACVVGVGSFTGIRIGVATVKALCLAFNKPALSITSFDTIAYNIKDKAVLSIIDAGHGGYYVCGYDKYHNVISKEEYLLKEQVLSLCDKFTFVSGEKLEGLDSTLVSIKTGLSLAIKQKEHNLIDADDLTPLYVRKSQAEEGRK